MPFERGDERVSRHQAKGMKNSPYQSAKVELAFKY